MILQQRKSFILLISLLITLLTLPPAKAQSPQFRPPLPGPLSLSGNFMELRNDHFHSGLDMRTDGHEGMPVTAAGDGWVSRIKIQPWGYGKALYIDHPNGYTTVYGHLKNYQGKLADAVRKEQYKAKNFEIDVTFKEGELPVTAGELVALSGNTGGSRGPHLHFEVRRTSDQHALDPELFGMELLDTIPPVISGIRLDRLDSASRTQPYPGKSRGFAVDQRGDSAWLKGMDGIQGLGTVGLSVNVTDRYNNSWSTCGIRKLRVIVDGKSIYSVELGQIDFGLQRYANAYMDYALFRNSDLHYNRCYKLPNNKLALYGPEPEMGRIELRVSEQKRVIVEATDANGNRTVMYFLLKGADPKAAEAWRVPKGKGQWCYADQENVLTTADARLTIPALALYEDAPIDLRPGKAPPTGRKKKPLRLYSNVANVHDPLTPLHTSAPLELRVKDPAPAATNKLLVVRVDGGGPAPIGGSTYENGWVRAKIRTFGDYALMLDTLPPTVVPINLKASMAGRHDISYRVGDDLSGIEKWSATLDGEWILFEYDPKRRLMVHYFDEHSDRKGKHELVLTVQDERGNVRIVRSTFIR
jgi:murein DD-endopeptidase MepM/ murein hydrolase activator NlpD